MNRFLIDHVREIQSRIETGLKRRFSEILQKNGLYSFFHKEEPRTEEVITQPVVSPEPVVISEPLAAPQEPKEVLDEQSPAPELPPAPVKPKAKRKATKKKSTKK